MLLWTIIALLTAAAILAVLLPLGRAPAVADPSEHARRVYRDQLGELERDKAEGRLSTAEAGSARAEVARRLIALDGEAVGAAASAGSNTARRVVSVVALAGIPVLSLALYVGLGAPQLPGQPLSARLEAPANSDRIDTAIAEVEAHLAEFPEDGRGWEVLAPVYLSLGRAQDAARAMENAIRILGSTAERQTLLGEALWSAAEGIVTADARAAFEAAASLDPDAPMPRFVLAVAARQEGNVEEARTRLVALLADAPEDAPWRGMVEVMLAELDGGEAEAADTASADPPGPSADDIAAAETMAPDEQAAMIEGMVSGLAARLEGEPDDVEGWLRLIRSYVVLGRTEAAAAAASAALSGVTGVGDKARVEALISDLGLSPAEAAP